MRIAVLIKQVPRVEALALGPDGRLQRDDLDLEMNAFCRRAVAHGVALAQSRGGSCTVFTLGPPAAADVLREAIAWGANTGVHITGPEFAGSDTLATARALAAAVDKTGPYDLVLVGRNAVDADTGQVGPAVAQFLGLPFLGAARSADVVGATVRARLEREDGWTVAEADLPAVVSCAERLCAPCKMPPAARAAVGPDTIRTIRAQELGPGPWGQVGSATVVGAVRTLDIPRLRQRLEGPIVLQVSRAVELIREAQVLEGATAWNTAGIGQGATVTDPLDRTAREPLPESLRGVAPARPTIAVLIERGRLQMGRELLGEAARLAQASAGWVTAVTCTRMTGEVAGSWGADELLQLDAGTEASNFAETVGAWCSRISPWAVLAPATMWGREVAARIAVMLRAGLTGDVIELAVDGHSLVCWKPAFGGRLAASITATSAVQMATVRPGILPTLIPRRHAAIVNHLPTAPSDRVRVIEDERDDDIEGLLKAPVVIGVGRGIAPEQYPDLGPLLAVLGAELAGTRRVTDAGWLPRSRQIGLTGISVRPRLYVAVGLSGKFNHMVGVRGARFVLAVNSDPDAPVFDHADVGVVGDWREVVPQLVMELAGSDGLEESRETPAQPALR
jgi:electron transfer flavoprotein alpha subunit